MKISIVIPARNEAERIETTLKYVLAQDYKDFEVIVVDNASTDNTGDLARAFSSVKVVREDRPGLLLARECGRVNATGEVIANLDADCLPTKDWLSRGAKYFNNPKVVAVTGPYDYYDGSWFFRWSTFFSQAVFYSLVHFILHRIIRKGAILTGGNNMLRVSALKQVGGYDTSIKFYGEDTDTATRLMKVGSILYRPSFNTKSSARRFKKQGAFDLMWKYIMNYIWVVLFKKPFNTGVVD